MLARAAVLASWVVWLMEIYALYIAAIIWLFAGNRVIKYMQKTVKNGVIAWLLYLAVILLMIPVPLAVMMLDGGPYSAVGVFFGRIAIFWFALLDGGARMRIKRLSRHLLSGSCSMTCHHAVNQVSWKPA